MELKVIALSLASFMSPFGTNYVFCKLLKHHQLRKQYHLLVSAFNLTVDSVSNRHERTSALLTGGIWPSTPLIK